MKDNYHGLKIMKIRLLYALFLLFVVGCSSNDSNVKTTASNYSIVDGDILKNGNVLIANGVNTLNTFGIANHELYSTWNINIVREFIGNLREQPISGFTIKDSQGSFLHPLQKVVDANRSQNVVTILCPFGWVDESGNQTLFTGLNPSDQEFYKMYKLKMKASLGKKYSLEEINSLADKQKSERSLIATKFNSKRSIISRSASKSTKSAMPAGIEFASASLVFNRTIGYLDWSGKYMTWPDVTALMDFLDDRWYNTGNSKKKYLFWPTAKKALIRYQEDNWLVWDDWKWDGEMTIGKDWKKYWTAIYIEKAMSSSWNVKDYGHSREVNEISKLSSNGPNTHTLGSNGLNITKNDYLSLRWFFYGAGDTFNP